MMPVKGHRADYLLLLYFGILLLFGLMMLTSASTAIGKDRFGDSYFFIKRQILFGVLPGLVAFFICAKIPYYWLKKYSFLIFTGVIILLLLVFIPGIGTNFGKGANSWISLFGYSFQPSEFAKLGMIIFLAWYYTALGQKIRHFKDGFVPALLIGFLPILLVVLQPDVGTVSILFIILFGLLFLAEADIWHLSGLALLGVLALVILVLIAPYRAARVTTFLHPELDPQGQGYHINQAFLAIGSGGFFGQGFGHSRQKFQYLPEVHADSIFAVIAEEIGFFFTLALLILLLCIAYRGFMIAKHAPDNFGRLLVGGIMIWFMAQSLLNIGAMVGLLPITGVPLLFISHGGTALLVAMAAVGLVINVSKEVTV
ncbi:MAG TPA: putative lipid II flippase FtsW [Candidatus Kapabacteria bacterium]|nr:putative lipid II flippase FtsW [Candidatus Kapabacteria bacterium]